MANSTNAAGDGEFIGVFLEEASDILDAWEACCIRLAKFPSTNDLDALFRSAHNFKGSARSVNLNPIANFVHKIEDLITLMNTQKISVSPERIKFLMDVHVKLVNWVEGLKGNTEYIEDTEELCTLVQDLSNDGVEKPDVPSVEPEWSEGFGIFEDAPPVKGKELGEILIENGHATEEQIERALRLQNRKIGEILVDEGITKPEIIASALEKQAGQGSRNNETLRVSMSKLDYLIRAVGELSIQFSIIQHNKKLGAAHVGQLDEALDFGEKIVREIQEVTFSLRVQPLTSLFQRLERTTIDISRQLNKKVELTLIGDTVEMDKSVIEKIKDPLIHILRNAIDHGIESSTDRVSKNKPESGRITIQAIQETQNIILSIKDDGKGLNCERILAKAKEKNLVSAHESLSEHQILQLIFKSGFSTAEKVTDVSGRGVGMDVVKRAVDELNGKINITSQVGQGTTFEISMPSSISVVDSLLVESLGRMFAIPVSYVAEVLDLNDLEKTSSYDHRTYFTYRGEVISCGYLSDYLNSVDLNGAEGVERNSKKHEETRKIHGQPIVVIQSNILLTAFKVDRIIGIQSIVSRPVNGTLKSVPGISGVTILPSGEPGIIVDIEYITGKIKSLQPPQGIKDAA